METKSHEGDLRVGIINQNAIVRSGLRVVIQGRRGLRICAESRTPKEIQPSLEKLQLDVLVFGVSRATESCLQSIRRLNKACRDTSVVVFSKIQCESFLVKSLLAGARCYISSDCKPSQIVAGIEAAAGQSTQVPYKPLITALRTLVRGNDDETAESVSKLGIVRLTQRESEVLYEMATGAPYKVIARNLFLAESTVKKYAHNVISKLGADNRLEAVIKAYEMGIARLPELPNGNGSKELR